jgi:hypothetical protein
MVRATSVVVTMTMTLGLQAEDQEALMSTV